MFSMFRILIIIIMIDMASCKLHNSASALQCKFLIKSIYLSNNRYNLRKTHRPKSANQVA